MSQLLKSLSVLTAIVLLSHATDVRGQLPVTQLRALYPVAMSAGSKGVVEAVGSGPLDSVSKLIFSHPGITAELVPPETNAVTGIAQQQFGKFNVTIAADVPAGIYEAWSVGRHGVSSTRYFG